MTPNISTAFTEKQTLQGLASQRSPSGARVVGDEGIQDDIWETNEYNHRDEEKKSPEESKISEIHSGIVGDSVAMKRTFQLVNQVAPSESTVLILGETGTGKELVARAIHDKSPRKNRPMVKVNCAALPPNLIESELFGHEKGSFTGATERRVGKFELANNGTLFLDEIGEMPLDLQVKLLRVLQEKEIERVGGKNTIKVNVRIIAATNRILEKEMEEGRFRSDLYYRLNIFPITLPALRQRKEDIPLLAAYFIDRYSKKNGRTINKLDDKILSELVGYGWPGNIRELEHLIERSILLSSGDTLTQIDLPLNLKKLHIDEQQNEVVVKTMDEAERDHILKMLKYCKGRVSGYGGAAEILGIPTSTLNSKMKRLGIHKEHI